MSVICQSCEAEKAALRAEVDALKKALDHWTLMHIQESAKSAKLEAQLSRLKEILRGRDGALEFYADPDNVIQGFDKASGSRYVKAEYHDIAKQALSKTWEEGE